MIKQEKQENGFIHTYSDENFYIIGGFPNGKYTEVFDVIEREYIESEEKIEKEEND